MTKYDNLLLPKMANGVMDEDEFDEEYPDGRMNGKLQRNYDEWKDFLEGLEPGNVVEVDGLQRSIFGKIENLEIKGIIPKNKYKVISRNYGANVFIKRISE